MIPDDPQFGDYFGAFGLDGQAYAVVADLTNPVVVFVVRGINATGAVVAEISPTGKSEWADLWADRERSWKEQLHDRAVALRDRKIKAGS